MIGAGLIVIAVGLTIAMFATKKAELGFVCTLWWAILSGHYYTLYTTAWVDIEYFIFFGAMGMAIFTMIAAFGLREKHDTIADEEIEEEGKGEGEIIDEEDKKRDELFSIEPGTESKRTKELKERADRRRKGERGNKR